VQRLARAESQRWPEPIGVRSWCWVCDSVLVLTNEVFGKPVMRRGEPALAKDGGPVGGAPHRPLPAPRAGRFGTAAATVDHQGSIRALSDAEIDSYVATGNHCTAPVGLRLKPRGLLVEQN